MRFVAADDSYIEVDNGAITVGFYMEERTFCPTPEQARAVAAALLAWADRTADAEGTQR